MELGAARTMLEEVIQYWIRYNACVDLFNVYLADAERLVEKSSEERTVRVRRRIASCSPAHVGHFDSPVVCGG